MKPLPADNISKLIAELKAASKTWERFEKKQLITWRIRFFIGLIIASAAYVISPESTWIWWLVLGLSAMSLVSFIITRFLIKRKLKEAQKKIDELKSIDYSKKL